MAVESFLLDVLMRMAMFALVQGLVYLILSKSSSIFSKDKMRSFSLKTGRSASFRRILAAISDIPQGGEPSPSSSPSPRGFQAHEGSADDNHKS